MMRLAQQAQPQPLGMAIELALTTGMRRGEVCALRWSDLGDDGTITVSHALGNAEGGFYEKEPKTSSSARAIPLTAHTFQALKAMRAESRCYTGWKPERSIKQYPEIPNVSRSDSALS